MSAYPTSYIATRQQELAEQRANGVYSAKQRDAVNLEAVALTSEFDRAVQSTSYNSMTLLDGSLINNGVNIQKRYGSAAAIGSDLALGVGSGTFTLAHSGFQRR